MHRNEEKAVVATVENHLLPGCLVDDDLRRALAERRAEKPTDDGGQEKTDGQGPFVRVVIALSPPCVEGDVEGERETEDDDCNEETAGRSR